MSRLTGILAAQALAASAAGAHTDDWIGTWTASPQPVWGGEFPLPTNLPFNLSNQTVRQVAGVSVGGKRVRVMLSNEYGSRPLVIGAAHLALAGARSAVVAGSDRLLTFGGGQSITIPAGAPVMSDPVELDIPPLSNVAVTIFLPQPTPLTTFHWDGLQTAYVGSGDLRSAAELKTETTLSTRVFLASILVDAPANACAVITLGDSITDGAATTLDANHRWPDFLARRLAQRHVAVLNAGISGARLLKDRMGVNSLARFERDVLSQPHVRTVIVLLGINDISWPDMAFAPDEAVPSADDLIAGYRQLIARAHARNVRILGVTLMPFEGALSATPFQGYHTAQKDQVRQAVNRWIRDSGEFDAVLDFDAVSRDPTRPTRLLPAFDSGDHLHPGDAGARAMAESIDLAKLGLEVCR